jgi:hypothetical protein
MTKLGFQLHGKSLELSHCSLAGNSIVNDEVESRSVSPEIEVWGCAGASQVVLHPITIEFF